MDATPAAVLATAWAAALITLLPPGLLEAGACRMFANAGLRAAAGFLAGIALLDAALMATLLGTGWMGVRRELSPVVAVTAGAGVCLLAVRRLWQARRSDRIYPDSGSPMLLGMRAAVESPGWWNWWLLVGSVAIAAGSAAPLAVGAGLMTGVLSWALVVLLTIRAGRRFIARVGERRWELATAWLLLVGGVLLVARSLL